MGRIGIAVAPVKLVGNIEGAGGKVDADAVHAFNGRGFAQAGNIQTRLDQLDAFAQLACGERRSGIEDELVVFL